MKPRDLVRAGGERAQSWLRTDRRLERLLHRLTKLDSAQTRYSHELIVPMNSTYSPWYDDAAFRTMYDAIAGHTFVDEYKCWELWEQLGQLGHVDGDVLEVGVWRGGTGILLARRSADCGFDAACTSPTRSPASPTPVTRIRGTAVASTPTPRRRSSPPWPGPTASSPSCSSASSPTTPATSSPTARSGSSTSTSTSTSRPDRCCCGRGLGCRSAASIVWDDYGSFQCEGVVTLGRALFDLDSPAFRLVHNLNGHLLLLKLREAPLELDDGVVADAVDTDG